MGRRYLQRGLKQSEAFEVGYAQVTITTSDGPSPGDGDLFADLNLTLGMFRELPKDPGEGCRSGIMARQQQRRYLDNEGLSATCL